MKFIKRFLSAMVVCSMILGNMVFAAEPTKYTLTLPMDERTQEQRGWYDGGTGVKFWDGVPANNNAPTNLGGRDCRVQKGDWFYFMFPEIDQSTNNVTIEFDYYDYSSQAGNKIKMHYYGTSWYNWTKVHDNYIEVATYEGTNTWKTAKVNLSDAKFVHSNDFGDVLIESAADGLAISSITAYETPASTYTITLPMDERTQEQRGWYDGGAGIQFWDGLPANNNAPANIDGRDCRVQKGDWFYYKINGISSSTTNVTIEFDYYDYASMAGKTIKMHYYSTKNYNWSKVNANPIEPVTYEGTNTWKTVKLNLTDCKFVHSNDYGDVLLECEEDGLAMSYLTAYETPEEEEPEIDYGDQISFEVNADGTTSTGYLSLERWSPIVWPDPTQNGHYPRGIMYNGESVDTTSGIYNVNFPAKSNIDGKGFIYNVPALSYDESDYHYWRNSFFFDMPNGFTLESDEYALVDVEYYAPDKSGTVVLFASASNGDYTEDNTTCFQISKSFAQTTDSQWQTVSFKIPKKAKLTNGWKSTDLNSYSNLKIAPQDLQLYIHKVTVSAVTYTAGDMLEEEAENLSVPSELLFDYALPTTLADGDISVSWASDNENVVSTTGVVNRPVGFGSTSVKLTATLSADTYTFDKDFYVNVLNAPYYTIDSLVFGTEGGDVSYSPVANGTIDSMHVTKYSTDAEDNATAYVAIYDAEDKLVSASKVAEVSETGEIELDITLPDKEDMYAKAFIWNSETLEPLAYGYSTKLSSDAKLYTIGDSTMQSYGTIAQRQADDGMTGWAQLLPLAVNDDSIALENDAVSGTSTLSFYNLGYIYPVMNNLKEGDYLLIQFGHNDEKPWMSQDAAKNYSPLEPVHQLHPKATEVPEWASDRKTYEQWLRDYAALARMKGAQVIYATSIYRHHYDSETGALAYAHYGYPEAMIDTAAETGTPLLDLHARTGEWLTELGEQNNSLKYYMAFHNGTDHTHLTYDGAVEVSNMALNELRRIGHPLQDAFTTVPEREIN